MKRYTIGSSASCDIVISNDEYVSPVHAEVWQDTQGRVWVADLGSTNGTHVHRAAWGGRMTRVKEPTQLEAGDEVRVGRTKIPTIGGKP